MTLPATSAAPLPPTLGLVFLDPAAGLTAGIAGGAAILALYFLKLRRRPVRVSSTLLWERATQDLQVNTPLRWLRPSWLLLLQLLGVAALAGALGRPALRSGWAPTGRVIILLDRSASMRATDGGRERTTLGESEAPATRLDEAKRRAASLVRRLDLASGSSEAMVIEFAATARVVAGLTRSRGELLDAIASVTPTDQPGRLGAARDLWRAFAERAGEEEQPRSRGASVVLFSDGSFAAERDPTAMAGLADVRLERCGPAPPVAPAPATGAAPAQPADAGRDNLGIVALNARREPDDPSTARVFFRAVNARATEAEARVVIRVNAQASRALAVKVPAAGERAESIVVDAAGLSVIEARLEGADLLASDDDAAVILPPPGGPRVLLVSPAGDGGAPAPDGAVLRALESLPDSRVRTVAPDAFDALAGGSDGLGEVDLVVFDRVEPRGAVARPSLHIGAGMTAAGVHVAERGGADGPRASRALTWSRSSPVLRDVSLDGLIVAGSPALDLPESAQTLATGEAGALIGAIESRGVRRVFVAFDPARSTWWLTPGFAIFVANSVEWLTGLGAEVGSHSLRTDEAVVLRPAPGAPRIRAVGPVTVEARVPPGEATTEPISLGMLERAGVYALEGAAGNERALAVNLFDPTESALATRDGLIGSGTGGGAPGSSGERAGKNAPGEGSREIWRWLAIAGVALLTVEWWLYAWRSRV